METTMTYVPATHSFKSASQPHSAWSSLVATANPLAWLRLHRQRRELWAVLDFPDYLLKDIGLQRHQIVNEATKPFWRP
jgi:uncharacterized protein YjiS (DUF1127 family)